ncbi:MAG: hypothetical protein NDJ90_12360, partial [Oligoflexia bacterium]|nr:hypothetical protein [Oligoflexia bacterium]
PASSDPWMGTRTLEEGAMKAVALARGTSREETLARVAQELKAGHEAIARRAGEEIRKLKPRQRYLRGMYTGGTYVSEAQVLLQGRLSPVFSNAPFGASRKPENALKSEAHTLIDFGEDEFTVGRPHPMIDFSLRNKRIFDEARDPEVAVLLFDLVLGWGAHPDPVPELVPVIEKAQRVAKAVGRHLPMVACVTGTDTDPQNRTTVVRALEQAGVIVEASHAAAAELAIRIAQGVN